MKTKSSKKIKKRKKISLHSPLPLPPLSLYSSCFYSPQLDRIWRRNERRTVRGSRRTPLSNNSNPSYYVNVSHHQFMCSFSFPYSFKGGGEQEVGERGGRERRSDRRGKGRRSEIIPRSFTARWSSVKRGDTALGEPEKYKVNKSK